MSVNEESKTDKNGEQHERKAERVDHLSTDSTTGDVCPSLGIRGPALLPDRFTRAESADALRDLQPFLIARSKKRGERGSGNDYEMLARFSLGID